MAEKRIKRKLDNIPEMLAADSGKRVPISQVRLEHEKFKEQIARLQAGAYCRLCDSIKDKDKFYVSTDPLAKGHVTPICKDCARKIALQVGEDGVEHEVTKETCKKALRYLDKPFLERVWISSINEADSLSRGHQTTNIWYCYMKNISMGQHNGKTYLDSDEPTQATPFDDDTHVSLDVIESYQKNKNDVLRLLDYDPFDKEPDIDKPFLYSQLLGMLDASEDANDDMLRVSSAIQIVRGFLQIEKIDDALVKLMSNVIQLQENSSTIKSLQDSKQKLTGMITNLAAESCLSLKNSKRQVKGENTWTGKIKKIKDMNLRAGEMNGFDVGTARGMQQVQEISDASIMKQLALDESEWSDIVADMRVTIQRLRKQKDSYQEINRVLLKENIDLKDYIEESGVDISHDFVDLKDLYSVFSDEENGIEFTEEEYESDNSAV